MRQLLGGLLPAQLIGENLGVAQGLTSRRLVEHRLIPSINAYGVAMNKDFQMPLGPLRFPGDHRGVSANVINCRLRIFVMLRGTT